MKLNNHLLHRHAFLWSLLTEMLLLVMASPWNKVAAEADARAGITADLLKVGVNYGRVGNDLPPPAQVAKLVTRAGIGKIKIFDADAAILAAFANTGVEIAAMAPDDVIPSFAANFKSALAWVRANIKPFIPATNVTLLMVGNEILTRSKPEFIPHLLPAMRNLHKALTHFQLHKTIKISTPHAMDVLDLRTSFPPSACTFRSDFAEPIMRPLLDFLQQTGSPFMISAYPFFAYRDDKAAHIQLEYALGDPAAAAVKDWNTGVLYKSMMDAQLDAVYSAMEKLNHRDVRVVVAETGWPSAGNAETEPASNMMNAAKFNQNLVKRILSNPPVGTPLRPNFPVDAYIFGLFNENQKWSLSERSFGLFYPNMTAVYEIKFTT